jgi:hypothetical protein
MSPITAFLNRLLVCAMMLAFAQHAFAAVLILEGTAQPSSAPPPAASTPGNLAPRDEPPAPAPSAPPMPTAPGESGILSPVTGPATMEAPAAAIAPLAPAIVPPILPGSPATPTDIGTAKVENSAEVSVEMMPGQTVSVGSLVSFRVTSKKAGYLVLVDVDTTGHFTQIYPNTASLTRTSRANGNYIKPGGTLTIPLATDPYAGIRYVVSPPNGQAMIVAILSARPVQILDLPDVPTDIKEKSAMLAYLAKWMNELRIPDDASQLREAKWSFNAKSYTIQ